MRFLVRFFLSVATEGTLFLPEDLGTDLVPFGMDFDALGAMTLSAVSASQERRIDPVVVLPLRTAGIAIYQVHRYKNHYGCAKTG